MKKRLLTLLTFVLGVCSGAWSQTTLASWDFSTRYETTSEESATAYYYYPNTSGEYTNIGHYWYGQHSPVFYPQTYVNGTQTDYYFTAASPGRYWQITGSAFLNESNVANNITNYADASSHKVYFEIKFPTTGYKDITLNFSNSTYQGVCGVTLAVSPDGGTTWLKSEDFAATSSATAHSVSLAVPNKEDVRVRFLCENGKTGYSYMQYVTVTGTALSGSETFFTCETSVGNTKYGTSVLSPAGGTYEDGASITATATSNTGWLFQKWNDGSSDVSTDNPYIFNISGNTELTAIYEAAPITSGTEITVAEWTFDTGYDVDGLKYTPNSSAWTGIAQTQSKNGNNPEIYANIAYKELTNYIASISNDNTGGTYYSVADNNGDKIFQLNNSGTANTAETYTSSADHLVYYEFKFPTLGLKDVNLSITYTDNTGGNTLRLVYSTDGGTTWTDNGTLTAGTNWYTYSTSSSNLTADNKENVIVHLLPAKDEKHAYRINNLTITATIATTDVTVSDALYATYYNSVPCVVPANLQAATVDGEESGKLTLNWRYSEGDVIPGGTAVLLKATEATNYTLTYAANITTAAPTGNYLLGSDEATTTSGGGDGAKYYALQYGTGDNASKLGFYYGAADGAAFTIGAHKAWLALPASSGARSFFLLDGETTSINDAVKSDNLKENSVYDLQGRCVNGSEAKPGLYIVNGKKIVIK